MNASRLKIIWARHTPTEWNRLGRLQGRVDIDIEAGAVVRSMNPLVTQMRQAEAVFSSTLARASRSAAYLASLLSVDHREDSRLSEMSFGPFEGRQLAEITATDRERLLQWMRKPYAQKPFWTGNDGETEQQIETFLDDLSGSTCVAVIGHTVHSHWLEHICMRRGIVFERLAAVAPAADVASQI